MAKRDEDIGLIRQQDRRGDPTTHLFVMNCGRLEGVDSCWLCGHPKDEHSDKQQESCI